MLRKVLSILRNAPIELIEREYLAEDNFTFLINADYNRIIREFTSRFVLKKRIGYEWGGENNIFMEPESQIDMQVCDFIAGDFAIDELTRKYNITISLHNDAINRTPDRNPQRVMADAIGVIGEYILANQFPCFLPYYEYDFNRREPRQRTLSLGLERFLDSCKINKK